MNVVFLGPSGIRKKTAAQGFLALCHELLPKCKTEFLDIQEHLEMSTHSLLKFTSRRQQDEIAKGLESLAKELDGADLNIVGLHATHLCAGIPVFPCPGASVEQIHPDVFVTLLDDVYACRTRLTKAGYPYNYTQLLMWRQIEGGIGDNWATAFHTENLYLAAKHPRQTLFKLLFDPSCPRLYSASQITNVRDSEELREEIDAHRGRIHSDFAVFDPLTIDDRILINHIPPPGEGDEEFTIPRGTRWECDLASLGPGYDPLVPEDPDVFPLPVTTSEARELASSIEQSSFSNLIDAQITQRDYRYIDQADVMAAYRPRLGHESAGVAAEKMYCAGIGETLVVEYSPEDDVCQQPSRPFGTHLPGPIHGDLEAFYTALEAAAMGEAQRRVKARAGFYQKFSDFRRTFEA